MKPLNIAGKTLKELWREPLLLGLMFAFPILLLAFYDIAFAEEDEGLSTYLAISVINADAGAAGPGDSPWNAGARLVEILQNAEWEGRPLFQVQFAESRRLAEVALRERSASLLLAIPADFSRVLLESAQGASPAASTTVTLVGYPASDGFVFAENILLDYIREFADQALGRPANVRIDYEFVPGTGTMSDFDFGVPGIIVFGVMFMAITTAETMVRENVGGTLRRLRLAGVRAADLLVGVSLSQCAVALVSVPITFGAAVALGFRSHGSLGLAVLIGLLLSLAAIGLGLLTACFARNDGEAANGSAALLVVMVLLSGTMYPMPPAPLFSVAGRTIQIYDLFPTTHAAEAMRQVLVFGKGALDVSFELIALTVLSLALLAAGIALYGRLKLDHT